MTDTTVYIGFSTPNWFNPVSWVVRKFTGSSVSHTWTMYFDDDLGIYVVLEAHELGFRIVPFERFEKYNKIVTLIDPVWPFHDLQNQNKDGLFFLAKLLGSMYDFPGLFGSAFVVLGKWLRLKWHNPFKGPRLMFCSEANTRALQVIKYPGADSLIPDDTSPQDLMEFLLMGNAKVIDETQFYGKYNK